MSRAVIGLLLSALVLGVPASMRAEPGHLRVAVPAIPASLDPATALEGTVPLIARQVFDTLLRYADGSSDVEPGLATQWSVSRDGLVWTLRLREGVRFHDGTPLTSQHVVESLDRLIRPNHPNAPAVNAAAMRLLRGVPGVVKEIKAPDSRTVQISLVLPYAPLPTVLAHPALSIALAVPAGEGKTLQGTGPFAIAEVAPDRVVLEGRPGHWAGGPRVARLSFTAMPDAAQAAAALDAQAIDLYFPAGAPPRQSGASSVPSWRIGYLALQTEKDPFNRVKLRKAIATALDPASISLALGAGALPLQGFLPTGIWGRREGGVVLEGNAERAKKLLAEAGALRRGVPPTLLVMDGDKRPELVRVGEAIRASLAAADLQVTVQPESSETTQTLLRAGEHQMALLEERADAGDPHFLLYPLSTTEGASKGAQATNYSFYRNPRLDDLLIRASQLSFKPERQKLYLRAQGMLADDVPWIPVYVRLHWAVARPEVRNLRLHPSGNHRLDRVSLDAAPAAPPTPPAPTR